MNQNRATFDATPDQVWAVLADGWLYPLWVVGATRMRDVDRTWPDVGSSIHHSVGVWPTVIDDHTEVLECEPLQRLLLAARAWPAGEARVEVVLEAQGSRTLVTLREDTQSGPGHLVPRLVKRPLIAWRNVETLRRLRFLVEGRAASPAVSGMP